MQDLVPLKILDKWYFLLNLNQTDLSWVQLRPWAELHWAEVGLGRVILHPPPTKQARNRVLKHQLLPYSIYADETWPRGYIFFFILISNEHEISKTKIPTNKDVY